MSLGLVLRYVSSLRGLFKEAVRQICELAQKTANITGPQTNSLSGNYQKILSLCGYTIYVCTYVYVYAFKMVLEIPGWPSAAQPLQLSSLSKNKEKKSAHG